MRNTIRFAASFASLLLASLAYADDHQSEGTTDYGYVRVPSNALGIGFAEALSKSGRTSDSHVYQVSPISIPNCAPADPVSRPDSVHDATADAPVALDMRPDRLVNLWIDAVEPALWSSTKSKNSTSPTPL